MLADLSRRHHRPTFLPNSILIRKQSLAPIIARYGKFLTSSAIRQAPIPTHPAIKFWKKPFHVPQVSVRNGFIVAGRMLPLCATQSAGKVSLCLKPTHVLASKPPSKKPRRSDVMQIEFSFGPWIGRMNARAQNTLNTNLHVSPVLVLS